MNILFKSAAAMGKTFSRLTVALLMFCTLAPASATTIVSTNIAEISELAEQAFVVKIDSVETSSSGNRSFDIVTATVVDPYFGDKQSSDVVAWQQFRFGPTIPLPAMPNYEIGKEYLIFLSGPGTGPGFQSPIGLGQGAFNVIRNPQTGAAIARNAYMNSTLSSGLDVDAAAEAIATRESQTRGLDNAARQREAANLKMQLRSRAAGTNLDALKKAAQFFHNEKKRGVRPSRDFRTTAPARILH